MEELDFGIPKKQEDNSRIAWSTEKIGKLLVKIDDGYKPKTTPFYEGNPVFRKGNIVYDYTPHEISEIQRCATDIVYFANNYATVMTDEGLQTIALRDYQEDMLEHFVDNRLSIILASRQIGKCVLSSSLGRFKIENEQILRHIPKIYKSIDRVYELPMYELNRALKKNINDYNMLDKIKYQLYKYYTKITK